MTRKTHWDSVYSKTTSGSLSWYKRLPTLSLELIARTRSPKSARIIDVGGGDSSLVDELVSRGYSDITVLDLSRAALERASTRLCKADAAKIKWREEDILDADFSGDQFDIWHDRAVFHFLTTPQERDAYIERIENAVRPGGHVIVATFAEDGPTRCSGLPVARYSATELHSAFGSAFRLVGSEREVHRTPAGVDQRFTYCWCRYDPVAIETAGAGNR